MPTLQPRYDDDCYYDRYGRYYCRNSAWNNWVRWVVLVAVVIGFFLFVFILCSCITARRRRRAGQTPYYGTGWASRPGANTAQPYYNNNNYQNPPPQYSAQPQNSYYGANQGYYGQQSYGQQPYGQQQHGVELQPPQATYTRGGDDVYVPPSGPPPGKGDGIVR